MINLTYISEFHKVSSIDFTKFYFYNLSEHTSFDSFASYMDKFFRDKIYICEQRKATRWSKGKCKDYLMRN
jgi:hypothetical protein